VAVLSLAWIAVSNVVKLYVVIILLFVIIP